MAAWWWEHVHAQPQDCQLTAPPPSPRVTSNFINGTSVHVDCDGDSLIYMGVPDGPSCHTVRDAASLGARPAVRR